MLVSQFKKILSKHPEDNWCFEFSKWEHMSDTPDGKYQGYRGWPNIVELSLVDSMQRYNDITGHKIATYVLMENPYDNEISGNMQYMLDTFVKDLADDDTIEFVLEVEESAGHIIHIDLELSEGDTGWADRYTILDLDEVDQDGVSTKINDVAKQIWNENNLEDHLYWHEEMWSSEYNPALGTVEHDGWKFWTNENSDDVNFRSPNGIEGEFVK